MKTRGFTIIEGMIVLAIFGIIAAIAMGPSEDERRAKEAAAVAGREAAKARSHCIGGYSHTMSERGTPSQILNEQGGGVPC